MRSKGNIDLFGIFVLLVVAGCIFPIVYYGAKATLREDKKPEQSEGTLICMVANTPTVQLYSSDVHYNGDGSWTLKHDVSGKYTTYVKSDEESCVIVPGKEAPQLVPAKPQPKVPPTTAYITPAPYVET